MIYPSILPDLPVVCIDFDDTLATSTWPSPELGKPIEEGVELLLHYYEENAEIVILTSRPESHWPRIWKWLKEHGLDELVYDVTNQKVRACMYWDDRAQRFPVQLVLPDDTIEVSDIRPEDLFDDTEPEPGEEECCAGYCNCPAQADEVDELAQKGPIRLFIESNVHDSSWEPSRHPFSQRFHEILRELGELHDQKSIGYGTDQDPLANVRASEDWGIPAWMGALLRAGDKVKRLQAYAQKGELPFEAVEDAFRDLSVYAIIGLVLFEQAAEVKV